MQHAHNLHGLALQSINNNVWERSNYELARAPYRSEEHTSELQSQSNLVCRLLLEKKNEWAYRDRVGDAASSRQRAGAGEPGAAIHGDSARRRFDLLEGRRSPLAPVLRAESFVAV